MGFRILPHYFGFHKQNFPEFWNSLYGAIRGHRGALKKRGGGGAIFSGAHNGTKKKHFKTSYIAVLIKIHLEFTRVFMLQNVVKKINSILARGGLMFGRAYNRCTFSLQVDRGLISGAGGGVGGGAYKRKFTVFSHWPMRTRGLTP